MTIPIVGNRASPSREDVRLDRRTIVRGALIASATMGVRPLFAQTPSPATPIATPVFATDPFTLGIASGEPLPDGVVLWTRLAPSPFEPGGGMPTQPVRVRWQVASDEAMRQVVQEGEAVADPAWAHSVHVEVSGLAPETWYWYRFIVGGTESPVGRTRTAPAAAAAPEAFRFAFASCQRWDHGLYLAYRDLAAQDVDLVVHLGDYIYESGIGSGDRLRGGEYPGHVMTTPRDLTGYRNRYALHKRDPDLQEAHRVAPWLVTWDDHEVRNNVFGEIVRDDPDNVAAAALLELRAAAYQAYYEHQPLRRSAIPTGPDLQLYRSRAFGRLLEFNLLDTRQYRSAQGTSCNDAIRLEHNGYCEASLDPARTMLGADQKAWLLDRYANASAAWNVLAQQVPFARIDNEADPALQSFGGKEMDKWDGYAHEREEIATAMADAAAARGFAPVVITGDVHASYVWDLKRDWDDQTNNTVYGTEFVGSSISSNGDEGLEEDGAFTTECGNRNGNAHNHLYDNHRGYVLCNVTPASWTSTYRVMSSVTDPGATASTLASYVVEHGNPGALLDTSCTPVLPTTGG